MRERRGLPDWDTRSVEPDPGHIAVGDRRHAASRIPAGLRTGRDAAADAWAQGPDGQGADPASPAGTMASRSGLARDTNPRIRTALPPFR